MTLMEARARLLDVLLSTKLGRTLLSEAAAEKLLHRQQLVDRIARKRSALDAEAPKLRAAVDKSIEKYRAAEAASRAAEDEVTRARSAYASFTLRLEAEIARDEAELRSTSDNVSIDGFISEMEALLQRLRRYAITSEERETGRFYTLTNRPVVDVFTNHAAVARAVRVILSAQRGAAQLRHEAVADVPEALAALRAPVDVAVKQIDELQLVGAN